MSPRRKPLKAGSRHNATFFYPRRSGLRRLGPLRHVLLAVLLAATVALAGCVTYGGGSYGHPPGYGAGYWDGFGAALAALIFLVLVLVVLALAIIVVLAVLAVAGRGPVAQVAGALLLVLGLLWTLAALGEANLASAAVGFLLAALGALALAPAPAQERARTIVLGERSR